ncbi:MAG: hypothetical protein LBM38_06135 [Clostridiales bacterium]|jgi:hypothetical protein|nr:hypothetical protein [Clostridiales bacterium]
MSEFEKRDAEKNSTESNLIEENSIKNTSTKSNLNFWKWLVLAILIVASVLCVLAFWSGDSYIKDKGESVKQLGEVSGISGAKSAGQFDDYVHIEWNGANYYFYGEKADKLKGEVIGDVDGDKLYAVEGMSTAEWVVMDKGHFDSASIFTTLDVERVPKEMWQYAKDKVTMKMSETEYPVGVQTLGYTIINHTGGDGDITLIPRLEKFDGGAFAEVKMSDEVGFCGTPDRLAEKWSGEVPTSYWGELGEGRYRLSFMQGESRVSAQFNLYNYSE